MQRPFSAPTLGWNSAENHPVSRDVQHHMVRRRLMIRGLPAVRRVHDRPTRHRRNRYEAEIGGVELVWLDPFDQQGITRPPGDQRIAADRGQGEIAERIDPA